MAVLYIKEQGAMVQKAGERIQVTKSGKTLLDLPILRIDNISVIGNVQITMQALRMLMENGIDVSYFTFGGKYLGHTGADSSKNIFLRFEQHSFYLDEERRLAMARKLVDNKIRNQISVIEGHSRSFEKGYPWRDIVKQMEEFRQTLPQKKTSNEILGIEGICSSHYFRAFGTMLKGDFVFESRNRRPPRDPVNIILSLAYTFLTREMCSALDAESFETYLGFLHGIRYGRKSLALDMMEEFRQPAVDRLVLLLFGKRMLGQFDFDEEEDGRILLNEGGFRKFCTEYERWMTGKNTLAGANFRKAIQRQAAALKKTIVEGEEYVPFLWATEQKMEQRTEQRTEQITEQETEQNVSDQLRPE